MPKKITAEVDYVQGHLRYGHFELILSDEEFEEYEANSKDYREDWIRDGDLVIDSFEVDGIGNIGAITIEDVD